MGDEVVEKAKKDSFFKRVVRFLCLPFIFISKIFKAFWNWIKTINIVGLANIALLSVIIVMFSNLLMNITIKNNPVEKPKIQPKPVNNVVVSQQEYLPEKQEFTLPLRRDEYNRKFIDRAENIAPTPVCETTVRQTARIKNVMYGDVIIDSRQAGRMLRHGDKVQGNLYIQNIRKFVLPCDMYIDGDLFIRDVNMLQFCGDFTVTGNIYVSPRSSFGPIPRTAVLGGQIII